ncbi:hypothetical protein CK216_19475 [Mesorhizobium sp. WSM3876]|nr:hypothetical protein CK216_19475 [Mesorhizobium sp. WSM3876]
MEPLRRCFNGVSTWPAHLGERFIRGDRSFLPAGFANVDGMAGSAMLQHRRFEPVRKLRRWRGQPILVRSSAPP